MAQYLDLRGNFSIYANKGTKRQLAAFEFFEGILFNRTSPLGAGVSIPKLDFTADELMPQVARFWGGTPSVNRNERLPQIGERKSIEPYEQYTRPIARQLLYANFEDRILQGDWPKKQVWKDIAAERAQFTLRDIRKLNASSFVGEEGFPVAAEYLLQHIVLKNKALNRAFVSWNKKTDWLKEHDARLDKLTQSLPASQREQLKKLRVMRSAGPRPANINARKKKL